MSKKNNNGDDKKNDKKPEGEKKGQGLKWALALAALGVVGAVGYMAATEDEGEWIDPFDDAKKNDGAPKGEPRHLKVLEKNVLESSRFYSFKFKNVKTGEESKVNFSRPDWQMQDVLDGMKVGKTYEVISSGPYITVTEIKRGKPALKVIKGDKDAPKPPKR